MLRRVYDVNVNSTKRVDLNDDSDWEAHMDAVFDRFLTVMTRRMIIIFGLWAVTLATAFFWAGRTFGP